MNASEIRSVSSLERVVIKSSSGKVYDLGNPNSKLFPIRLWWYKFRRRKEFKHASS